MSTTPVRIVVVEDSPLQRAALIAVLQADGDLQVVGEASDVVSAVAAVEQHRPDLVTMDLELPGAADETMGGLEAIRRILAVNPVPIAVLSVHTPSRGASAAIEALAAGALDVLPKPEGGDGDAAAALRRRLRILARVPIVTRRAPRAEPAPPVRDRLPVVALAASTGGPGALRQVVGALRGIAAPVLVVQHIHPDFVQSFARWLEEMTLLPVVVPADGDPARPGAVHVAPAETHLRLGPGRVLRLDPEPELLSRPSADELLDSVAEHAGAAAVAAVLTGMGDDGAAGLGAVRRAGGTTFAQDGETAVVDGMPRAARELGAAEHVLPLEDLGPAIARRVTAIGGR